MDAAMQPLAGATVLVVEDSYLVATEMRRMVQDLGGKVLGPAKGLDAARTILAETGDPDLAVLDVNLDGDRVYGLARELRERGVPFLFATGYDSWALEEGFAGVPLVSKPVASSSLAAAIAKLDPLRKLSTVNIS
jgi:CheY-like chemotaxis protein